MFWRKKSSSSKKGRDPGQLKQAAQGDATALEAAYEAHVDGLYGFVYYRVGRDPALAEDVVQETFAKALDQIGQYDPGRSSIQTWLRLLSRNVIRDQLRAHGRSDEMAARWEELDRSLAQVFAALDREPLSEEVICRGETRDLVNVTIAHLPERYRTVLTRKYIDGETLDGLAGELGLTQAAVSSLLVRARRAFREAFAQLSQSMAEVS